LSTDMYKTEMMPREKVRAIGITKNLVFFNYFIQNFSPISISHSNNLGWIFDVLCSKDYMCKSFFQNIILNYEELQHCPCLLRWIADWWRILKMQHFNLVPFSACLPVLKGKYRFMRSAFYVHVSMSVTLLSYIHTYICVSEYS
jgi:hypothetical protein